MFYVLTVQVSLIMETEQACEVKLFQGNLTSTDGLSSACIPLRTINHRLWKERQQSEVTLRETVRNHRRVSQLTFFDVDSWRSESTGCPLSWRNGNQRCCCMRRGSGVYRLSSHNTVFTTWQETVLTQSDCAGWTVVHLLGPQSLKWHEHWLENWLRKHFTSCELACFCGLNF